MELTFEAGKNMVLVDGQAYFYNIQKSMEYRGGGSDTKMFNNDYFGWHVKIGYKAYPIVGTTNTELPGIHHIPREWFVRKVDVEELSRYKVENHPDYEAEGFSEYMNGFFNGIIEGYNANKAEFTSDDILDAINTARICEEKDVDILDIIRKRKEEIELPQSITITSDFKHKIDTIWKD